MQGWVELLPASARASLAVVSRMVRSKLDEVTRSALRPEDLSCADCFTCRRLDVGAS